MEDETTPNVEAPCPNCAHGLVGYRAETQSTMRWDVDLRWAICPNCLHVSLRQWRLSAPIVPESEAS